MPMPGSHRGQLMMRSGHLSLVNAHQEILIPQWASSHSSGLLSTGASTSQSCQFCFALSTLSWEFLVCIKICSCLPHISKQGVCHPYGPPERVGNLTTDSKKIHYLRIQKGIWTVRYMCVQFLVKTEYWDVMEVMWLSGISYLRKGGKFHPFLQLKIKKKNP